MPSFAVDRTLGRLAKWLRIMGFDTVCEADATGCDYPGIPAEGRILLTRNSAKEKDNDPDLLLLIRSDHVLEQLQQVVRSLDIGLQDVAMFSRCLQCNRPIEAVAKPDVRHRVPDYIYETHHQFSRCPNCRRIYWPGTHAARSREVVRRVFEQP